MTKSRTDSDGNSLARKPANHRTAGDTPNRNVDSQPDDLLSLVSTPADMNRLMAFFSDHESGCLKVRRSLPGADLHLTWTWSTGPHAGTYVYVRVEYWRILFGLELLERKVREVYQDVRKPTPDRYSTRH